MVSNEGAQGPNTDKAVAFNCQRCGHCCYGKGGIVLREHDVQRLATHLQMTPEDFLQTYTESPHGKPRIIVGDDAYCVFFKQGQGCSVHVAKPDVCRAWPFFRGNLIDESSWEMASDYCPGIILKAGHKAFAAEGLDWLRSNGLLEPEKDAIARALGLDLES